jgi:cytochrome b561
MSEQNKTTEPNSSPPEDSLLLDAPDRYGRVSRINHWLGAVLIIGLLGIGLYFEDLPRGAEKLYWMKLHISIGTIAFLFLLFRVLWRVVNRETAEIAQPPMLQWMTRLVHPLLLLGIAVLLVTGPFAVWSGGRDIEVFDWFVIPGPIDAVDWLHEALQVVHAVMAKVLLVAVILHLFGTVKHLLFERDRVIGRMFGNRSG